MGSGVSLPWITKKWTKMKLINILLIALLLLLVRKLAWCLRWLWCYYHGKETPEPISFLPRRSGETFAGHIQKPEDEED